MPAEHMFEDNITSSKWLKCPASILGNEICKPITATGIKGEHGGMDHSKGPSEFKLHDKLTMSSEETANKVRAQPFDIGAQLLQGSFKVKK